MAELITTQYKGANITVVTIANGVSYSGEVIGNESNTMVTLLQPGGATVRIASDAIVAFF